jgi:hypothetical protein
MVMDLPRATGDLGGHAVRLAGLARRQEELCFRPRPTASGVRALVLTSYRHFAQKRMLRALNEGSRRGR